MITKGLALAGGLCCALAASQFPEFSQQYKQRLSGAVDELAWVVERFDADAAALDLSRDAALSELARGTAMARARSESMGQVLIRHERLSAHLEHLRTTNSVSAALIGWQYLDPELAQKTWGDFEPAVPATVAGAGFGLGGFLAGYTLIGMLLGGLGRMVRRRPEATPAE